jgi:hypothetical protein
MKKETDPERRAIALTWLFHLVGDIHRPLHTAQLFTVEYPKGDRGGNEICVRVTQAGQPMDLHRFWGNLAPKPPGVSARSAQRTWEQALSSGQKKISRLRRRLLTETAG